MKDDIKKTSDVEITEDVSFRDMMLSEQVLAGLTKCNFVKPSPIQLRAIPIGRCGLDLIIQSKSGTGKTLVFCTIILQRFNPELKTPQSLIVVPTREIALQVETYLNSIGSSCTGFRATCVIGGRDIAEDRIRINKCKAIVGTPGRILHLIKNKYVCLENIQTLVLDEADKLVTEDFYQDINILLDALSDNRQIIASSATYANGLDNLIVSFMHNPVAISTARDTPVLIGVKQFILPVESFTVPTAVENSTSSIQEMWRKISAVEYILRTTSFKQCILFSNSQFRANSFANYLTQNEWTVELILGSHDQNTRTATLEHFRQYKSRILVTTDLMARGVDIVNVNLVINLDVTGDSSTYLHRIGRCGRFGRRGLAITLAGDDTEMKKFRKLLGIIGGDKMKVATFPINLDENVKFDAWNIDGNSDSSDSYVFGVLEDNETSAKTETEIPLNKSQNNKKSDENESDSIKSKNLNLLEVAKLLVDTEPSKQQLTISFDEDLFENFQSSNDMDSAQPELTISENIFDEFLQFKSNASNEEQKEQELPMYILALCLEQEVHQNEVEKKEEDEEHEPKPCDNIHLREIPNIFTFGTSPEKVAFSKDTKKVNKIREKSENHKKIVRNSLNNKKSGGVNIELPTSNQLWTSIYWQQLDNIHRYVAMNKYW